MCNKRPKDSRYWLRGSGWTFYICEPVTISNFMRWKKCRVKTSGSLKQELYFYELYNSDSFHKEHIRLCNSCFHTKLMTKGQQYKTHSFFLICYVFLILHCLFLSAYMYIISSMKKGTFEVFFCILKTIVQMQ